MSSSISLDLLLLLALAADAQLEVQIRRYDKTMCNCGLRSSSSNYSLINYSFLASGFSTDCYANIPAEGITGILYQPEPEDGCLSFNSSFQGDCPCADSSNLSRVALLDNYHQCTAEKIQGASFDAIITHTLGDSCLDVGQSVCDPTTNETLDASANGVPLAVVSEEFYAELLVMAALRNCSDYITLVTFRVGSTVNFGSVHSALIALFVLCGLVLVTAQLMCCFLVCLICDKLFWRKRGRYNVQENHMLQLRGLGEPSAMTISRGAHILPYTPEEREFHRTEGDTHTQCSICLEEFHEGEMITALACDKNHAFHPSCIDKWLNTQSTCPVCRTSTYS